VLLVGLHERRWRVFQRLAFRLPLADERVEVTLAGTDGAKGDDCDRILMDIQSDRERASLGHG
jgi:hypothetical protein